MGAVHDKLAEDLALCVGPSPFLSVPLGSCWLAKYGEGPPRADVVTVVPSYTQFCVSIYEVKTSREDFYSDIKSDKWRSYLPHCHRFYFATPVNLVEKSEIPEEAGWIVKDEKGWKVKKHPKVRTLSIPERTLQSLLFMRERKTVRQRRLEALLEAAAEARGEDAHRWGRTRECDPSYLGRTIGKEIAKIYAKKYEVEKVYSEAKEVLNNMNYYKNEFEELMQKSVGIDFQKRSSMWRVLNELKRIVEDAGKIV